MRIGKPWKLTVFIVLFLAVSLLVLLCIINPKPASCVDVEGKTYYFVEYPSTASFKINNISIKNQSLQQVLSFFGNDIDFQPVGRVQTVEDAVRNGVFVLNETYPAWTYDNRVAVCFDNEKDIWIVHGQLNDRNSAVKTDIGAVIFDASTGQILGVSLLD